MMKFILPLFFILFTLNINAQSDSTHWEAQIIVRHPSGNFDTLTIGADILGSSGLQPGLDIIDTSFVLPLSIRSLDTIVYQQFNTCPANMRKDIRSFQHQIVYTFYVKSDTFPYSIFWNQPYPADSMITILYDTTQFIYANKEWVLTSVSIYSVGGYMEAIDGDWVWIKSLQGFNSDIDKDIVIIYEQNPPEYYWGQCNSGDKVIRFDMVLGFEKTVGISKLLVDEIYVYNNMPYKYLEIFTKQHSVSSFKIIDIFGKVVHYGNIYSSGSYRIPYNLKQGIYFLVLEGDYSPHISKFLSQ